MNIGELLRTAGRISPEQLQAARDYQKANGGSVGHALVTLGFVSDEDVAKLLSRIYATPWVDLEQHEIDPAVIRMIPSATARRLQVLPIDVTGRVLTVAMADPTNVAAVDELRFMTGYDIALVVASETALSAVIERGYGPTCSLLRPATVPSAVDAVAQETPGLDTAGLVEVPAGQPDASVPEAASGPAERAAPAFLRPPARVVWSLVAVNVAIFGLELLWGGSSSLLTLVNMGAGLGRAGLADQPWRIVSAAFLHLNLVHLALNMWALVVFGRMLEVMLGARRFVVLYGLSALGGGLASSLVHAQIVSAGASGAVWGLMTAQIALIVRLKREYGHEAVPVPTSALMKPLVINLLFSLLPFIDTSAHLGGGAVGAALIFSGCMWGPRPAAAWRPAAWVVSLGMAGCVLCALAQGRPWELRWPPALVPRALAGTPISVPVPRGLQARPGHDKDEVVFGDSFRPLIVYCQPERLDAPCSDRQARACLSKTAKSVAAQPLGKGWSDEQPPRVVELRGRPAASWILRSPAGGRQLTWVFMEGSWQLRLDVTVHPEADGSWASLPAAIAKGVTFGPPAPQ